MNELVIRSANCPNDLEIICDLFREYQQALGVDLGFQDFDSELAHLPGDYSPPRGCLLLALIDNKPVGCAALRPIDDQIGELKRLYVKQEYRSVGAGRRLTEAVICIAKEIGYGQIYLDTLPTMIGAQKLYESLGFMDIEPYRHNPISGSRFLGLDLNSK